MRGLALALSLSLGCFGYNSGAKKWSYVGNSLLVAGGGAAIALDLANRPEPCMGAPGCYHSSIGGGLVAGAVLVTAGLVGIVINATRGTVKTSR